MLIDLRTEGLNIYFLCPFIGCFCLIGASFSSNQSKFGKYPFLQHILISISEILAVIPYLISNKIKKKSLNNQLNDKVDNLNEKSDIALNEIEEEKNKIKILDTVLLGFLIFLESFILNIGYDLFNNKFRYSFMTIYILFLIILQKYILDNKIYRYQMASFLLFLVFDSIYLAIIFIDKSLKYNALMLIFIFISNLIVSFVITYEKKILKNQFISVYKLCIFLGIFSLIFNIIASVITSIVSINVNVDGRDKIYLFNYKYYIEDVDDHVLKEIILIFVFVILNGVNNILQLLTIKYLSQNHVLITYIMLAIYYSILIKFQEIEIKTLTFAISIVFYLICFFILFIYLEIIQLNFWGISKDITIKKGFRSDVDKYMQSFSSDGEEDADKELIHVKNEETNDKTISLHKSELDSYEND
jgi:hypothetical protein